MYGYVRLCKSEQVENWKIVKVKIGEMEIQKSRKLEKWKTEKLSKWKCQNLEKWKIGVFWKSKKQKIGKL